MATISKRDESHVISKEKKSDLFIFLFEITRPAILLRISFWWFRKYDKSDGIIDSELMMVCDTLGAEIDLSRLVMGAGSSPDPRGDLLLRPPEGGNRKATPDEAAASAIGIVHISKSRSAITLLGILPPQPTSPPASILKYKLCKNAQKA